jgi:uncharacterized protein DUF2752
VGEFLTPKGFQPSEEPGVEIPSPGPAASGFPARSARRAHLPILLMSLAVIGLAILFQVTPDGSGITVFGKRLPESCLIKSTSGESCPGCGLTRSFVTGIRLDLNAFRFHPIGPILLLVLVAQVPYRGYRLLQGRPVVPKREISNWPLYALGLIALGLIGTWGARMAGAIPS